MAITAVPPSPTPSTGLGSTSFTVWLSTFIPGLLSLIDAVAQNSSPTHLAVAGAVGAVLTVGSTIAKLLHDKGIHVATIAAAGSDVAAALPGLRVDLQAVEHFIELDWPASKAVIDDVAGKIASVGKDVEDRVKAVEAKIATSPTIEDVRGVVHSVLVSFASAPVAPVALPITVPAAVPPVG